MAELDVPRDVAHQHDFVEAGSHRFSFEKCAVSSFPARSYQTPTGLSSRCNPGAGCPHGFNTYSTGCSPQTLLRLGLGLAALAGRRSSRGRDRGRGRRTLGPELGLDLELLAPVGRGHLVGGEVVGSE